jgi:hypothetical protein
MRHILIPLHFFLLLSTACNLRQESNSQETQVSNQDQPQVTKPAKPSEQNSHGDTITKTLEQSGNDEFSYSVNFIWINNRLHSQQKYIFPDHKLGDFNTHMLNWAKMNTNAPIYLWYDGEYTSQDAIASTNALITKSGVTNFTLKDIRDLNIVKQNAEVFSYKLPVYFRADLIRPAAAYEILSQMPLQTQTSCFVYADIDVPAISKAELFDKLTTLYLNKLGIVMASSGWLGFENSFQIFCNKQNILRAIKLAIIDVNFKTARLALAESNEFCQKDKTIPLPNGLSHLPQRVYDTYPNMFRYLYHLELKIPVIDRFDKQPFSFEPRQLGPFGIGRYFNPRLYLQLTPEQRIGLCRPAGYDENKNFTNDINIIKKAPQPPGCPLRLVVPTKKVEMDRPSLQYDNC